jgi:hypothetical protein
MLRQRRDPLERQAGPGALPVRLEFDPMEHRPLTHETDCAFRQRATQDLERLDSKRGVLPRIESMEVSDAVLGLVS